MTADSTPRIVFRADASLEIGTGHVMRCLALAEELDRRGAVCEFVCRESPGNRIETIRERGFEVHALAAPARYEGGLGVPAAVDAAETFATLDGCPADWVVADHYGLDAEWERQLRPATRKIMVIDDLADRRHDCELLLDQNLGRAPSDYDGLVPEHCERLCGPDFALLRPEFAGMRPRSLERRVGRELRRILVTMGGVDKLNATGHVLEALSVCDLSNEMAVTVVMGGDAPWTKQIQSKTDALPFNVEILTGTSSMAQIMTESDFAIGAAGSTSWERCCLGLPSALVVIASNQVDACRALVTAGAAFDLGRSGDILNTLPPLIKTLRADPELLSKMSKSAAQVCDGLGVNSVSRQLLGI